MNNANARVRPGRAVVESLEQRALFSSAGLDPTFAPNSGTPGVLQQDVSGTGDTISKMIVLSDGNVLVGGEAGLSTSASDSAAIALAEYSADGTGEFFNGGKPIRQQPLSDRSYFNDMTVMPTDQSIVIAGRSGNSSGFLVRFGSGSTPQGIQALDFVPKVCAAVLGTGSTPDSVIAVGNGADGAAFFASFQTPAIGGFGPTPSVGGGTGEVALPSTYHGLQLGQVLNAVRETDDSGTTYALFGSIILKVNADGSVDQTSAIGPVADSLVAGATTVGMTLDANHRIVIAGNNQVERFATTGGPDLSFGNAGIATINLSSSRPLSSVTTAADGSVFVAGSFPTVAAARLNPDGTPDANFGPGGVANITLPGSAFAGDAIALQSSGAVLVAGDVSAPSATVDGEDFGIARLSTNITGGGGGGGGVGNGGSALQPTLLGALPTAPLVAAQRAKPLHQSIRITNSTTARVTGTAHINVVLASDPTGAGGVTVATLARRLRLNPGKSLSIPIVLKAIPTNSIGTFYLVARVTDPNGATGTGASAGTVTITPASADLSGAFLKVPNTVQSGRRGVIGLTVSNAGNITATGILSVHLFASADGSIGPNSIDLGTFTPRISIPPGRKMVVRLTETLASAPPGAYFLVASLDEAGTFPDPNLGNNVFASALPVQWK